MKTTERDDVRDRNPGPAEQAGEGVGGIGGTLAGAALGSAAGPVGTILGGIAGAVGGWWAGEEAGRALEDWGDHEEYYKVHHDAYDPADVEWSDAQVGYSVGHVAGRNPDYRGRSFADVEYDLRRNWTSEEDFLLLRPYVEAGFHRASRYY